MKSPNKPATDKSKNWVNTRPVEKTENKSGELIEGRSTGEVKPGYDFGSLPLYTGHQPVQAKLNVNEPGDKYEQEADAVADAITQAPSGQENVQLKEHTPTGITNHVQANSETANQVSDPLQNKINSAKGSGTALDGKTQAFMSGKFGIDFSKVRIHADDGAAGMNSELNAKAFTVGSDIYFNRGQYNPNSAEGKKLLAHELTHTVQQQHGGNAIQKQDDPPVAHYNKKTKQTTYEFLGKWYEQKHFDFFSNAGYETMKACLKEGFSMTGALFVVALITTESGWGTGNGGKEYHNLFSIMGGQKGNISTAHGTLKKFASYEDGFQEGFIKRIVDGTDDLGKAKFPKLRPALAKPDFTIDEANEAFGQAGYYSPGKRYSYEGDGRLNWASKYFGDIKRTTIPFMKNEIRNRIKSLQQFMPMLPAEDQPSLLEGIRELESLLLQIDSTATHVEAQLAPPVKKK